MEFTDPTREIYFKSEESISLVIKRKTNYTNIDAGGLKNVVVGQLVGS